MYQIQIASACCSVLPISAGQVCHVSLWARVGTLCSTFQAAVEVRRVPDSAVLGLEWSDPAMLMTITVPPDIGRLVACLDLGAQLSPGDRLTDKAQTIMREQTGGWRGSSIRSVRATFRVC